ncbi:MAG: hypothetical protein ACYTBX_15025 [Planctomycetota bacterium]
MKIPFALLCPQCKQEAQLRVNLQDTTFEGKCKCGQTLTLTRWVTVGLYILKRSWHELTVEEDYSLSIVFSAVAFECQLTQLYFKWSKVSAWRKDRRKVSDDELEKLLRKWGSIDAKIEKVSKLMDPRGFQQFVIDSPELTDIVKNGCPSLDIQNLTKGFQQRLFWPRNRVLHLGDTTFSKEDAIWCYGIAALGLKVLEQMDEPKTSEPE